jgi:beta-1,4-N-acetylglucosaminyltransferase
MLGVWYDCRSRRNALTQKSFMLVTVGSTDFDALIQTADRLVPSLQTQGVMQIGRGQYIPANIPHFRFAPSLAPYLEQASLVIAHGGLGTTMEVLNRGLPLVSVSNPECHDNHQDELLSHMSEEGYLVWCHQLDELEKAIEIARTTSLQRYQPPGCEIHLVIHEFLRERKGNRRRRKI